MRRTNTGDHKDRPYDLKAEKDAIGLDNMRWLLETGVQHREHHPATEH